MVAARGVVLALAVLAAGCQCGFDAGKLDDLACSSDADCRPGQYCLDGTCSRRDCEAAPDCGDGFVFDCVDGRCAPVECEGDEDCPRGSGCFAGFCVPGAGPCELHADCEDDVFCDGAERCVDGRCEAGPPPDCGLELAPCEVASCDEETRTCSPAPAEDGAPCEDGDPCTGPDTCTDQVCSGSGDACDDDLACTPGQCIPGVGCVVDPGSCAIEDACWSDGDPHPSDPCLACDADLDPRAWSPGPAAPCDDGNDCTSSDVCGAGVCAGTPYACDDGLACTDDLCDGRGGCLVETTRGTCRIGGLCFADGDPNPANPCEACDPAASDAAWTADDAAVPLDDGIACTTGRCAGGLAEHIPSDAACNAGQVCALCAGGCATPPPTLAVDCGNQANAPGGPGRDCVITGSSDVACLACTAEVGMTSIVRQSFDGCPWIGQLGWDLVGAPPDCDEDERLEFIDSGHSELERVVDTRDFDSVRMCFRVLGVDTGNDDVVSVEIDTGGGFDEVWSRAGGPFANTDWVSTVFCVDLVAADPAAADNPALGVRLSVDTSLSITDIDDIAIDGWHSSTIAYPGRVTSNDFAGCALGGWVPGGDGIACPGTVDENTGVDVVEVNDAYSELAQVIDLSDRCDDIRVGFGSSADGGFWPRDYTDLYVDYGAGDDLIWGAAAGGRPDSFQAVELVLSHRIPEVRFQSAVAFRYELAAGAAGATQWLDDIWIDGATCGSGAGIVDLAAVAPRAGGAQVAVSADVQATAYVSCTWDGRVSPKAHAPIVFRH